jgi:hypothetical protein
VDTIELLVFIRLIATIQNVTTAVVEFCENVFSFLESLEDHLGMRLYLDSISGAAQKKASITDIKL